MRYTMRPAIQEPVFEAPPRQPTVSEVRISVTKSTPFPTHAAWWDALAREKVRGETKRAQELEAFRRKFGKC